MRSWSLSVVVLNLMFLWLGNANVLGQIPEAERHFQAAKNYQEQRRYLEAVAEYREVLRLQPKREQGVISLALLLTQMGLREEAQELCHQHLRLHPELFKLHLTLASLLIPHERYDEASREIQSFLDKTTGKIPKDDSVRIYGLYLEGITLIAKQEPEKGEARLLEVVKFNPEHMEAHRELGELYSQSKGTYEQAVRHFYRALEVGPDDAVTHQRLGKALLNVDRDQEAIEHLQKSVELSPTPQAYFHLGTAYRKRGDEEKVKEMLSRFRTLDLEQKSERERRNKAVRLFLEGQKHVSQGEFNQALAVFQECRELAPKRSQLDYIFPPDRALFGLAFAHLRKGNLQKAQRNIEKAIELYPYDSSYHEMYATSLVAAGNYAIAIPKMERAIQLSPTKHTYHNDLGNLFFQVEEYQKSVSAYRQAAELEPHNPFYHLNLSSALAKVGEEQESQKEKELYRKLMTEGQN